MKLNVQIKGDMKVMHKFQFVAPLAEVRASVNFFLVSSIETTFLDQSGPNSHEVFMGTRSRMNSIIRKIRQVTPDLLALKD